MVSKVGFIVLLLCCCSCNSEKSNQPEIPFDKIKWNIKEGLDYLHRNQMVNDVLYNDSIRSLPKNELLDLLGQPDYIRKEYLYYRITEKRLGSWILHTKTIVFKLSDDSAIEWIKIHE